MPAFTDLFCGCSWGMSRAATQTISDSTPVVDRLDSVSAREFMSKGPVPASCYEADPDDLIDWHLSCHLLTLDRSAASRIMLRKVREGEYEVDGRRVMLLWREDLGPGTPGVEESHPAGIVVREGDDESESGTETPLAEYLQQAVDVAALLAGHAAGCPAVARMPANRRLTFADVPERTHEDPGVERVRSMRVACEQARIREQHAVSAEKGLQYPSAGAKEVALRGLPPHLGRNAAAAPPMPSRSASPATGPRPCYVPAPIGVGSNFGARPASPAEAAFAPAQVGACLNPRPPHPGAARPALPPGTGRRTVSAAVPCGVAVPGHAPATHPASPLVAGGRDHYRQV